MINFPGKNHLRKLALNYVRKNLNCVFVLSTGRVGTDTLTKLLECSNGINSNHEPDPVFWTETKNAYQSIGDLRNFAENFLNTRLFTLPDSNYLRSSFLNGVIYAETSNRLTYVANELSNYFSRSRFIHLHRHPAEVVRSGMRRKFYDGNSLDQYRITPRENDLFYSEWSSWGAFEKTCWYWRAVNEHALNFSDSIDEQRVFDLPSECLFENDTEYLRKLFRWLDVDFPTEGEVGQILKTKHNAQLDSEFPKWPDWPDESMENLERISGTIAERLGYKFGDEK